MAAATPLQIEFGVGIPKNYTALPGKGMRWLGIAIARTGRSSRQPGVLTWWAAWRPLRPYRLNWGSEFQINYTTLSGKGMRWFGMAIARTGRSTGQIDDTILKLNKAGASPVRTLKFPIL
jgi:hypothetical protein